MEEEETEIKDPKAVLAALERAKNDAKTYREEHDKLQQELNDLMAEHKTLVGEFRNTAIKSALEAKGLDAERISTLIDTEKIELKDGKVTGLDDSIADLEKRLPELFDKNRRVGGRLEMEPQGDIDSTRSVSELQARQILNH